MHAQWGLTGLPVVNLSLCHLPTLRLSSAFAFPRDSSILYLTLAGSLMARQALETSGTCTTPHDLLSSGEVGHLTQLPLLSAHLCVLVSVEPRCVWGWVDAVSGTREIDSSWMPDLEKQEFEVPSSPSLL